MRFAFLAAAIIAALPAHASAESGSFYDGNQLNERCTSGRRWADGRGGNTGAQDSAQCAGYIQGVSDLLSAQDTKVANCIGNNVTTGQLVDVVMKYFRENPAKRQFNAAAIITIALSDAFCSE